MSDSVLEFVEVRKSFGHVHALRDVTFAVQRSETVALLGPNGAGKSTAISLLLGLRSADHGIVRIEDRDPRVAGLRGSIGAMLQETALPPGLKVRELVEFYRSIYPKPWSFAEVVERANLADILERRVERLSGGQRRRLAFALAIAGNPRILFLDEPTAGMDAGARLAFWQQIDHLASAGRTVLFTTHYLEEADVHSRRVLLLHKGRLLAEGRPEELRRRSGGRTIRFSTPPEWAARLAGMFAGQTVVREGGMVRIHASADGENSAEAVIRRLVHGEVPMRDLEVTTPSLETALRQLEEEASDDAVASVD